MIRRIRSWQPWVFLCVVVACGLFVVLTFAAMLFYPGGTLLDPTTKGYSFLHNFFSELGLAESRNGQPNTISATLFVAAMAFAGGGLASFFFAFRQFFTGSRVGQLLSGLGSIIGVLSGLCFIATALVPVDLFREAHKALEL